MVSKQDVEHVAKLARLELNEAQKEKFTHHFSEILEYFNLLGEIDTQNIEPMTQAIPMVNVMRADENLDDINSCLREKILANAPLEEDGFFKVPKII